MQKLFHAIGFAAALLLVHHVPTARGQGTTVDGGTIVTETIEHLSTMRYSERKYPEGLMTKWFNDKYQGNVDNYVYEAGGRLLSWEFTGWEIRTDPISISSRYYGVGLAQVTYVVGEGQVRKETPEASKAMDAVRDAAMKALAAEVFANEALLLQLVSKATALARYYHVAGATAIADKISGQAALFSAGADRAARLGQQLGQSTDGAFESAQKAFDEMFWEGLAGGSRIHDGIFRNAFNGPVPPELAQLDQLLEKLKRNAQDSKVRAGDLARRDRSDDWETIPANLFNDTDLDAATKALQQTHAQPPALPSTDVAPWTDNAQAVRAAAATPFQGGGLGVDDDEEGISSIDAETYLGSPFAATTPQADPFTAQAATGSNPMTPLSVTGTNPFTPPAPVAEATLAQARDVSVPRQGSPDLDLELATLRKDLAQVEERMQPAFLTVYQRTLSNRVEYAQCEADRNAARDEARRTVERRCPEDHFSGTRDIWIPSQKRYVAVGMRAYGAFVAARELRSLCPGYFKSSHYQTRWNNYLDWNPELLLERDVKETGLEDLMLARSGYARGRTDSLSSDLRRGYRKYILEERDLILESDPRYGRDCFGLRQYRNDFLLETTQISTEGSSLAEIETQVAQHFNLDRDEVDVLVQATDALPQTGESTTWGRATNPLSLANAPINLWPPVEIREIQAQLDAAQSSSP